MTQIILTGVSGSGKTTLMNELIFNGCHKPLQFTTRKPRDDKELDDYVFLTKEQFIRKLDNGDFIEHIVYNGEYYAITKYFDTSKSNVFVADPAGKAQLLKHFKLNGIKHTAFFLDIPKDEARRRLEDRGETVSTIEKRLEDFKYFLPSEEDDVLDGRLPIKKNLERILKFLN